MADRPLRVFISYKWDSYEHNKWVEKIATDLRRAGIESILDKWEVRLGGSFSEYMTSKIGLADVVLFIMTNKSVGAIESTLQGGAVKFEIQLATSRKISGDNMRLIGIYREDSQVPLLFKDYRYADFRDDAKYEESLGELIKDLRGAPAAPELTQDIKDVISSDLDGMHGVYVEEFKALQYSMGHDDGMDLHDVCKADIVLAGISATGKTPLSLYLASRGYKTASIPLVRGIEPPQELFDVNQNKVFALIIDAQRLVEHRSGRLYDLKLNPLSSVASYANYESVVEELKWCANLFQKHSEWQVIDVTNKSTGELAAEIIRRLNSRIDQPALP